MSNLAYLNVIAGISWEPEIRGALVVLVGGLVLFGSVWLILATNIGNRVGSMIALAGFFGWMAIMGAIWWIYGIGLKGDTPVWVPTEVVHNFDEATSSSQVRQLGGVEVVSAAALVDQFCPGLVDATVDVQRARFVSDDPNLTLDYSSDREYCNEGVGEKLAVDAETISDSLTAANNSLIAAAEDSGIDDSRILAPDELEASIANKIADETTKLAQLTLSNLASAAPGIIPDGEEAGLLNFNGWTLLSSGEAGEAIASADVAITAAVDDFGSSADFFVLDTFQRGGKPERSSDGVWDRVYNEIRNTVVFWHPKNTTVVTVTPTLHKDPIAGQAPPFSEISPEGRPVSLVMVRDLGDLRLPSAIITMASLLAFLGLCLMLHLRDIELERRIEAWDPAAAT
jgi:hypothetical protein